MISALSAVWGGAPDYLAGNAQVFDGSFDTDIISTWNALQRNDAVSYLIVFDDEGSVGSGTLLGLQNLGINLSRDNTNIRIQYRKGAGQRAEVRALYIFGGKNIAIITYDGSSLAAGFNIYNFGILEPATIIADTLASDIPTTGTSSIGATNGNSGFFNGKIKQIEIINRVATSQEIIDASEAGSFRGAGIAHDSGEYLLAVDFDKVDGQDPTTFSGTPAYTITANGGSTYAPYL